MVFYFFFHICLAHCKVSQANKNDLHQESCTKRTLNLEIVLAILKNVFPGTILNEFQHHADEKITTFQTITIFNILK